MSGENIYNLLGSRPNNGAAVPQTADGSSPYTGEYETRMKEPPKPVYSTFHQRGKEYDGTNVRFFKQRDAVIGKDVADTVDPQNYLKRGEGVRAVVPPIHKEKMYRNPPVTVGRPTDQHGNGGEEYGNDNELRNSRRGAGGNSAGDPGDDSRNGDRQNNSEMATNNVRTGFVSGGCDENGRMGVPKSRKNFIAANIVEMSNLVPKNRKDQPMYATDRADFAKVPAYLGRVKGEVQAEKSFVQAMETQKGQRREQVYAQYVYRLPPDEQADLVSNLERRLKEKTATLSSMPFSIDTVTASRKKNELERSIKEIESALTKLAKEAIFVYRDDPVNGQWTKAAAIEEAKKYAVSA